MQPPARVEGGHLSDVIFNRGSQWLTEKMWTELPYTNIPGLRSMPVYCLSNVESLLCYVMGCYVLKTDSGLPALSPPLKLLI